VARQLIGLAAILGHPPLLITPFSIVSSEERHKQNTMMLHAASTLWSTRARIRLNRCPGVGKQAAYRTAQANAECVLETSREAVRIPSRRRELPEKKRSGGTDVVLHFVSAQRRERTPGYGRGTAGRERCGHVLGGCSKRRHVRLAIMAGEAGQNISGLLTPISPNCQEPVHLSPLRITSGTIAFSGVYPGPAVNCNGSPEYMSVRMVVATRFFD